MYMKAQWRTESCKLYEDVVSFSYLLDKYDTCLSHVFVDLHARKLSCANC